MKRSEGLSGAPSAAPLDREPRWGGVSSTPSLLKCLGKVSITGIRNGGGPHPFTAEIRLLGTFVGVGLEDSA